VTVLRWQQHVGFAVESSGWGISPASAANTWVPCSKADFHDNLKYYYDTAYRSVQAMDFGAYPTTGEADFDMSFDMYVDTAPFFLGVAMVGDNDQVTIRNGTYVSTLYTGGNSVAEHTFILGTPKSMTLFDYNGFSERSYQGARPSSVAVKYKPDGSVNLDVKGKARLSTLLNTTTVAVIGGYAPVLGWQAVLTLNGSANPRLIDASLDFKRGIEVLYTQAGTQSPTNIYTFPLEIEGDLTVDFQDEVEYQYYRTGNQSATFDLFFVSTSNNAFRVNIPQPLYTSYALDRSKDAFTAKMKFKGIYNASLSTNVTVKFYNSIAAAF
jgi:hypothetical protein